MNPVAYWFSVFLTCLLCLCQPWAMADSVVGCQRPKMPMLPKPNTVTAKQIRQLEARAKVYNAGMRQYINCLNRSLNSISDDLRQIYIRRSLEDARREQNKFQKTLQRINAVWRKRQQPK